MYRMGIVIILMTIISIIIARHDKGVEEKDIFLYGMCSLVVFLVTGSVTFYLYQNSKKEIDGNYQIVEATICEKK